MLVYQPEIESGQELAHAEYPFDGIGVFGVYPDTEEEAVLAMIDHLSARNPEWRFAIGDSTSDIDRRFRNWRNKR